jgi:hypothetical protein
MRQFSSLCEPLPLNDSLLTHLRIPAKATWALRQELISKRCIVVCTVQRRLQQFNSSVRAGIAAQLLEAGKEAVALPPRYATIPSFESCHGQGKYNLGVSWLTW